MNDTIRPSDELDLLILLEKLIAYFKRYAKILLIFTILGCIGGLFIFLSTPKKYKATLVLHSFNLTNLENIEIILNWKELLKKHEYKNLASILNCDSATIRKLYKIDAEEIQKLYLQTNPHGFNVHVLVKDTSVLNNLQQGIVFGLGNGEYVRVRTATKRANLNQLIEKVNIEISKLDSTKLVINDILNNKSKNSSSLMIDITSINSQIISLNEKLLNYKEELKFSDPIQVIQGFTKFNYPERRGGPLILAIGILAGFIIGYFVTLIIYVSQKLRKTSKK